MSQVKGVLFQGKEWISEKSGKLALWTSDLRRLLFRTAPNIRHQSSILIKSQCNNFSRMLWPEAKLPNSFRSFLIKIELSSIEHQRNVAAIHMYTSSHLPLSIMEFEVHCVSLLKWTLPNRSTPNLCKSSTKSSRDHRYVFRNCTIYNLLKIFTPHTFWFSSMILKSSLSNVNK